MIARRVVDQLLAALRRSPVVLLNGPRQSGKTTLVRSLPEKTPRRYISLDEIHAAASARADPGGFVTGLQGSVALDEVQHAPELFPAIKLAVDRRRAPGRFLLTGSANVLLLPRLAESLAGRMQILTLWPLSQGELEGTAEGFIDTVFGRDDIPVLDVPDERADVIRRALRGGYPEIADWPEEARRDWFASYVTTLLQRDVRDLAHVEGLTALPNLLSLLAVRSGSLLNFAELSRSAAMAQSTLKRYVTLFEATFMVDMVPAWSANLSKRLIKAPRLVLTDTGLMSHLARVTEARIDNEPPLAGWLLESFVVTELRKQAAWSAARPDLFHFRALTGQEVDLILEDRAGRVVGVEIKASTTVGADDFRGLETLRAVAGRRFHRGVVLYTGRRALPFGHGNHALPISALWRLAPARAAR
jgi:predicted AAA+ superfamily ATPase